MMLTGAPGRWSAIHSSTGKVQHSTWSGMTRWRIVKSSPQARIAARFWVTVSQYQGVLASAIAQRPGPNLKSGSQTSVSRRRMRIASPVMKKLLFQSIGALNAPAYRPCSGCTSYQNARSPLVPRAAARSAGSGAKSRPSSAIASTIRCRWIVTSPPTQLTLWLPSIRSSQAMVASVRASTTAPLSLSVLMSPFWQNAQRMLHEVKKIVPEPASPR